MSAVKRRPRHLSSSDIRSFLAEACQKSFQELKDKLTSAPVLTLPEGTDGFVVYCDSSIIGRGCVLMKNGKVISYASSQFKFWSSFQKGLGTAVKLCTDFHPQTDGQVEHTIQNLEDMLIACVIDFKGNWDDHLPFIEFTYNNNYHSSICIPPFEELYGRRCKSFI
ncbi:hypothetical protein MTR67_034761 [Solanum verrucosum]|uniref:Reverse transcriptase/retrotransposon-derived protein RNase H-like domain-containing protein n=1 Tax=Solanum verrucosum TaxID=315347 RepID=A0AAF0U913_SOLVR|nr:hypothetical protein MTR67_034761 [Solanum verrucosum]